MKTKIMLGFLFVVLGTAFGVAVLDGGARSDLCSWQALSSRKITAAVRYRLQQARRF